MTGRKCGSCKHYEHAPIWRKGWCRNPLLYSPQQSHLVGEEDLDCERGMGNYWESLDAAELLPYIPLHPVPRIAEPASRPILSESRHDATRMTSGSQVIYPVSGSSGYPGDPIDDDDPLPRNPRSVDPRGHERQLDYYSEERYWTDYVRIGLPILGVILIMLVALLWIIPFFGGDDDDDGSLGASGTATTTIAVIGPDATATSQAETTTPRLTLTSQPTGSTPTGISGQPTETSEPVNPPPDGEIFNGATVAVANTGGTGVNMRDSPSVDGEIVTVVPDGTEFVTTGEAEEADGFLWWPVEGEAGSGYIVEDYLILVE